jgi:hypothetical protein
MQFFYDSQIRRFVLQFIRYFSEIQVEYGRDDNGNMIYLTVPCRYADTNRAGSAILRNNSENTINNVPMMAVYIDSLKYHREHIQDPTYLEKKIIRERAIDPVTGDIKTYQKNVVTVERYMPVPYLLGLKLDIYTSNLEQKLQIIEQIVPWYNPSREIQNTENYLDWTSLSYVTLTDVNFSSRSIPVGTEDPIDVATLSFELHMYITTPAKVKKLNAVTSVVATMYGPSGDLATEIQNLVNQLGSRQWFTPSGYDAIVFADPLVSGQYKIILSKLASTNSILDTPIPVSDPVPWRGVVNYIGEISNGISMMAFVNETTGNLVIGTISYDPTDPNVMLFELDTTTVPSNTLLPINNIIDPMKVGPGRGLPAAAAGQRYLIINNNIGNVNNQPQNNPSAWLNADHTPFIAYENDIIEYDGTLWSISYSAADNIDNEDYVTNLYTGIQYKWVNGLWQKSWEGIYKEGLWLLII